MKDFRVNAFNSSFQKKKQEYIQEIDRQKRELSNTERRHQEIISSMERKFIQEKVRLQRDVDVKLADLAISAHDVNLKYLIEIGSSRKCV